MAKRIEFTLSRHAAKRMRQRGNSRKQIARALAHPDRVEPDADDPQLRHALK